VVLYLKILVCSNTPNEMYDTHDLNIVLKMSKTWLEFRSVQFFGYKIIGANIELTQDLKDNIQAICFLKIRKQFFLYYQKISYQTTHYMHQYYMTRQTSTSIRTKIPERWIVSRFLKILKKLYRLP
jgi:hypothetical protein